MGANVAIPERKNLDTIPKLVKHWSESLPDQELFVFYNGDRRESYTCRQVFQLAGKFSSRLRHQYGFKKGDIIANTLPNSPERVFTDLGIILAGCVTLNGSTFFSDGSDFLTSANSSGLLAAIVCPEGNGPAWRILKNYIQGDATSPTAIFACDKAPLLETAILVSRRPTGSRGHFLQELQDSTEPIFVEQDIQPDDILIVVTTSGSTGYCKLVAKTHRDLIDQWLDVCTYTREHSRQQWTINVVYNDRHIGWMAGYPSGTYINADTRVLLDVFDTQGSKVGADTWKIICAEKVDYAIILPMDLDYLLKHTSFVGAADYKMKMICGGGQPIRKDQSVSYHTVAQDVCMVYATTEAGLISYGIVEENKVKDYFCGQVAPEVELRVVDADNKECQTGQVGTIHIKGKAVFKGYLNRVENPDPKTLFAFTKDGWLNTDDSGYFDEDRNLYVLGRLKDVIIFGTGLVYPGWLEPKIVQHPAISEACIVPVSDPVLYHNICAIVKPVHGSDISVQELETICRGIFLTDKDMEGTPVPKFYLTQPQRSVAGTAGKAVFKGYLNRVENPDPKTLLAFTKDGWLNTDDSGYFDEDRNVYVLGRLKDVIIFGATFVYPGWLEPKIAQHPAISEACIVPVSDPVLYHNICAIVKPVHGSDISVQELETICRGIFLTDKDIEGTPVPKFYLILQDFPQTATGKVDRKVLQTMAEEKFGVH